MQIRASYSIMSTMLRYPSRRRTAACAASNAKPGKTFIRRQRSGSIANRKAHSNPIARIGFGARVDLPDR